MKLSSHFIPRPHSDLILWKKYVDEPEFLRDLLTGDDVDAAIRHKIINIIQNNWDSFCKRGFSCPMLDFEFRIDTGNSPSVCCRQPVYGFHESKIMIKLIADLEANKLIRDYEGPWGSSLLLTAKPHQESCTNISAFIWRVYVSYRPLNEITLGFEFPISRCADSIEDLGDSCGPIFTISLDTRSGYHQIRVRKCDQEKFLADKRRQTKSYPSNQQMYHLFTLQWCSLYGRNGYYCSKTYKQK